MCACVHCTYYALLTTPKSIAKGDVYKHTLTHSHTCTHYLPLPKLRVLQNLSNSHNLRGNGKRERERERERREERERERESERENKV